MKRQKYSPVIPQLNAAWERMISRCYNKSHEKYKFYGGRGVIVCDQWKNSYQSFLDWSILNGWKQGLQIDKDIKGNGLLYSSETCCWVTPKENQRARKSLIIVNYKGENITLVELCERFNIKCPIVKQRINRDGMTLDQALSVPNNGQGNFKLRKKHEYKSKS